MSHHQVASMLGVLLAIFVLLACVYLRLGPEDQSDGGSMREQRHWQFPAMAEVENAVSIQNDFDQRLRAAWTERSRPAVVEALRWLRVRTSPTSKVGRQSRACCRKVTRGVWRDLVRNPPLDDRIFLGMTD